MNKFVLVLLAISMTSVFGTCDANYLSDLYGIHLETAPVDASAFTKCASLKTYGTSCCTAATIDGFQAKIETITANLTKIVSARDKFFIEARKVAVRLNTTIERLKNATEKGLSKIQQAASSATGNDALTYTVVAAMAQVFAEMGSGMIENLTQFQANFTTYQESRKTCVTSISNILAASWCLACHPDSSSLGLDDSNEEITLHADLKSKLTEDCAPFIILSASQNSMIVIYYLSGIFSGMANGMEEIANGNVQNGAMSFFQSIAAAAQNTAEPSDANQIPAQLPDGCDGSSCDWILTAIFNSGKINQTNLAAGGEVAMQSIDIQMRRLLTEEDDDDDDDGQDDDRRVLSSGTWDPSSDDAGVTVEFETNPANVDNNDLSGFRVGLLSAFMAAIAFLFF